MLNWLTCAWSENKSLVLFVFLMFIFRSAFADWNTVPSGSMKPTILEGDRIFVNKMAYDLRVPFTHMSMIKISDPQRGDIVVFDSKAMDKKLVKRIVGVPGDIVELRDNVLHINGVELGYQALSSTDATFDKQEDLLGVKHKVRMNKLRGGMSSFKPVAVPADMYLALGDNRDNSADSRVIGFVPRSEIVGRTKNVVLSFNYENYYIPRENRFFHTL